MVLMEKARRNPQINYWENPEIPVKTLRDGRILDAVIWIESFVEITSIPIWNHALILIVFPQNSCIEKAFLFDVVSKIYIATDSSPVDMPTYELCCDMIDVVIDISCIYG